MTFRITCEADIPIHQVDNAEEEGGRPAFGHVACRYCCCFKYRQFNTLLSV